MPEGDPLVRPSRQVPYSAPGFLSLLHLSAASSLGSSTSPTTMVLQLEAKQTQEGWINWNECWPSGSVFGPGNLGSQSQDRSVNTAMSLPIEIIIVVPGWSLLNYKGLAISS